MRMSCCGFFIFTSTPPCPAFRRISASVPAASSRSTTASLRTITAWPISRRPKSRAAAVPHAMSRLACASGLTRPSTPCGATRSLNIWWTPRTRKPWRSNTPAMPRSSRSSPPKKLAPSCARMAIPRRSGRNAPIDGRRTRPTRTMSLASACRSAASRQPAAPSRHHTCGASTTVPASHWPSIATTKKARSVARQWSINRRGSAPPPARIPSLGSILEQGLANRTR